MPHSSVHGHRGCGRVAHWGSRSCPPQHTSACSQALCTWIRPLCSATSTHSSTWGCCSQAQPRQFGSEPAPPPPPPGLNPWAPARDKLPHSLPGSCPTPGKPLSITPGSRLWGRQLGGWWARGQSLVPPALHWR